MYIKYIIYMIYLNIYIIWELQYINRRPYFECNILKYFVVLQSAGKFYIFLGQQRIWLIW